MSDTTTDDTPPRRRVLQGTLALGCGLLVPAALFGCDSGKQADATGAAPEAPPSPETDAAAPAAEPEAPAAAAEAPAAAAKVSQASVQYQNQPKGDQKCSGCLHFIPESNACALVEGQISPEGWCMLWAKKSA